MARPMTVQSKGADRAPELEEAILSSGQFAEACVFPIPDSEIGHRIGARSCCVPARSVHSLTGLHYPVRLAGRIAPFKLPHRVVVLAQLPKFKRQDPAQRVADSTCIARRYHGLAARSASAKAGIEAIAVLSPLLSREINRAACK